LRLACLQFGPIFGQIDANLAAIRDRLPAGEADLVVLPELCTTGYTFADRAELESLAEEIPGGPSTEALTALAAEKEVVLCAGLAERAGDRVFNSAVLVGPGGFVGSYRKIHLFDRENRIFDPGDRGFAVFEVGGVKIGIMICFDWFYPESMRALALSGAEVVAHPSNLVLSWCQRSMPVRCLENHVIAATANRSGEEERAGVHHRFTGASQITGFGGEILAHAPEDGDAWIVAPVEPARSRQRDLGDSPDILTHRRPEFYR